MSDELKPCPFCGGKARYRTGCGVECSVCFANIVDARRLRESVCAKWNRRSDAAALSEAQATIARLEAALRLIELIGYREGEEFGWINAHMRGVATAALSGDSIDNYWRLFPNHRRAALSPREGEG